MNISNFIFNDDWVIVNNINYFNSLVRINLCVIKLNVRFFSKRQLWWLTLIVNLECYMFSFISMRNSLDEVN